MTDSDVPSATPSEPAAAGGLGGLVRLLTSILPVLVTVALMALLWAWAGGKAVGALATLMTTIFVVAGKFIVFSGVEGLSDKLYVFEAMGLDPRDALMPYYLATLVVYMDVCVAFLVAFNLEWMFRVPAVGPRLENVQSNSAAILAVEPWLGKFTFFGCMAFVAFPVSGTGAIGGTLLGRLMGLSRLRIMVAILLGAVAGAFGMAYAADHLSRRMEELMRAWFVAIPALLAFIAFFVWLNMRIQRKVKQHQAEQSQREA